MPNPEVKPARVDGTVWGTHGRADSCQFRFLTWRKFYFWGFLLFVFAYDIILFIVQEVIISHHARQKVKYQSENRHAVIR